MMKFLQGNLLDAPTEALVNTVNTVGVMGKGIALMFKEAFPDNFRAYDEAVKRKEVRIGRMLFNVTLQQSSRIWKIVLPRKTVIDLHQANRHSLCHRRGEETRSVP